MINSLLNILSPHRKRCYLFSEGSANDKKLLGLKGSHLCEIFRLKLSVPPGFIITSECMEEFKNHYQNLTVLPKELLSEIETKIRELEKIIGRKFGGVKESPSLEFPLLLSIRDGNNMVPSIPYSENTVLNVGLNDAVCNNFISVTNNPKFMLNLYQRFLMDFGKVVYGIDAACYQNVINNQLMESKLSKIEDFSISDLQKIVIKFKDLADVPSDPYRQLELIIIASIKSWHDSKNVQLRRENGLADANNAITIQSMVYGNLNQRSGNGVCTTRNTITGSPELVGAYTVMCEGEDTVTSKPFFDLDFIKHDSPACYADLVQSVKLIEKHFKDAQTVDFTIENGHLYILKTSTAKREPSAAIKIATDMVNNNVLSEREAIMRIDPNSISADGICANVIAWAMKFKRLDVYCKVSSIAEAKQAFSLYADGVELECSQLLMTENRIDYLRKFILTDCPIEREETVGVIMSMLEGDLKELFIPYGVHKRIILHTLSDIPWNTLCPTRSACLQSDSHSMCCKADDGSYNPNNLTLVLNKVLIKVVIGVVTSLFSDGIMIRSPELMMNHSNEVNQLQLLINTVGEALNGNKASTYVRFGIQLKSPRSCILADSLPLQNIDFLSIDTEKLTSAAIGDDEFDSKKPTLDLRGVGFLIQYAARKLRKGNPVTKLGCNGCFAQDPTSILFMDELGLDYITVDGTNRLPCAIIAAAQSHILSVTKQKEMEDSEYVFWLNLDNQLF